MFVKLQNIISELSVALPSARFYLVGGSVRDSLLFGGFDSPRIKDFDVEVFNVSQVKLLETFFNLKIAYDHVGQHFGVYKVYVDGETFDFSFPREEKKLGVGYKGFEVDINPFLSLERASIRRDLTVNSIMYDLNENKYIDVFGGMRDLELKLAVPTSEYFKEDPLRVLRAFQFISRFDFSWNEQLVSFCKELLCEKEYLTPERVWVEWEKWATKSLLPSKGLQFLLECGWIEGELFDLIGIQQDPTHHPEGDAFIHTLHVCDAANEIAIRENLSDDEKIILNLSALLHDLGKANTTFFNEKKQKWVAYGHNATGVPLAENFLKKINCPEKFRRPILTLVEEHMVHLTKDPSKKNLQKLINRLVKGGTNLKMLSMVVEADCNGRPPSPKGISPRFILWLDLSRDLGLTGDKKIEPIVTGDDLISLGFKEGKELGDILKFLYDEQINCRLTEENKETFFKTLKKKIKI